MYFSQMLNSPQYCLGALGLVNTLQSVVVKGLERNITCLYEARRLLLGLDSNETAKVTPMTPDPVLANNGPSNHWLNMLLQQLRLSEQGEHASAFKT